MNGNRCLLTYLVHSEVDWPGPKSKRAIYASDRETVQEDLLRRLCPGRLDQKPPPVEQSRCCLENSQMRPSNDSGPVVRAIAQVVKRDGDSILVYGTVGHDVSQFSRQTQPWIKETRNRVQRVFIDFSSV